jgi:hypothetical protein
LLAGLPLLALTQLWGGVDLWLLLAATLAAGLNVLAVGGVSVACSAHCRTALGALIVAYGIVALVSVFATLFCFVVLEPTTGYGIFAIGLRGSEGSSALLWQVRLMFNLLVCIGCNGTVAAVAILDAIFALRGYEGRVERAKILERTPPESLWAENVRAPALARLRDPRPLPPVGDWPLLWREVNRGRQYFRPRTENFLARYWPVLLIATTFTGWLLKNSRPNTQWAMDEVVGGIGLLVLVLFAIGWCGDVAFRAAMSVCREREQKTLDDLLLLPDSRATILGAKWLGAILESRIGYVLMFLVAFLIGAGLIGPLQGLILVATLLAQLGFLASFGLRVSVASHTMLRAQVTTALMLLVFFAGGWIALSIDEPAQIAVARAEGFDGSRRAGGGPELVRGLLYRNGLNPIGSWVFLAIPRLYFPDTPSQHKIFEARDMVTAWGALTFALAAAVLWLDAWRCLQEERQR